MPCATHALNSDAQAFMKGHPAGHASAQLLSILFFRRGMLNACSEEEFTSTQASRGQKQRHDMSIQTPPVRASALNLNQSDTWARFNRA